MTLDEMEQRDLTYLEQVYGAQAERDAAAHEAALKAKEQARQAANRNEYIGNELMQKYLPQYQAMQGTAGMGTSSTDALVAYNAYLGRVSGNNAAYEQNVTELNRRKEELDYQRDAEKREREFSIRDVYEGERQTMAQEESEGLLSLMAAKAAGYYGSDEKISQEDYDNLLAFYQANEHRLTESGQRNALDALAEYREAIREEAEQKAMDRNEYISEGITYSRGLSNYGKVGNNFWVKDASGKEYAVELGEQISDPTVTAMADKADSGEVFAYGGKLYLKKDQTVYAVNRREQTKHKEYESLYNLYFGSEESGTGQEAVEVSAPKQKNNKDFPTDEELLEYLKYRAEKKKN